MKRRERHGDTRRDGWRAPEYSVWVGMKQRCLNPKAESYSDYGGRGIGVCRKWRNSYSAFLEDMGRRPSPFHSIHRKNNDGDYTPKNCVWSLIEEQSRHKRSNNNITAFGKTRCVTDWAADLEMSPSAITRRLQKGWSPEEAVSIASTKIDDEARLMIIDGDTMRLPAWAALSGIAATTIWHRVTCMGWSHKKAVFTPVGSTPVGRKPSVFLAVNGETATIEAWAAKNDLKRTTIDERIKRGWSVEEAVSLPVGARAGRGVDNGNAKLTASQVKQIKKSFGAKSNRQLGREFGVSKTTIAFIRNGLTWKD
jgi:hypothetical protein